MIREDSAVIEDEDLNKFYQEKERIQVNGTTAELYQEQVDRLRYGITPDEMQVMFDSNHHHSHDGEDSDEIFDESHQHTRVLSQAQKAKILKEFLWDKSPEEFTLILDSMRKQNQITDLIADD